MPRSLQLLILILVLFLNKISAKIIFEDEFNELNETKW